MPVGFGSFAFLSFFGFNWNTVDFPCCVHFCYPAKWLSYMHILSLYSFPSWFIPGYWVELPVLYSRTLLILHSISNSLHLLISHFQSILSPAQSFAFLPRVQQVTKGNSTMRQDTSQNVKYHLLIHLKPKCLIERTSLEKGDQTCHAKETKGRLRCYDREGNNLEL